MKHFLYILFLPFILNSCDQNIVFNQCQDNEWYVDQDGDGYGSDVSEQVGGCEPLTGYADTNSDCDDLDASINEESTYYQDSDEDGFGSPDQETTSCTQPTGYVENNLDCDDNDSTIGVGQTWYEDADEDGLGNPDVSQVSCDQPDGYVENNNDNDDTTSGSSSDGFGFYYPLAVGNQWLYQVNNDELRFEIEGSMVDNGITKYNLVDESTNQTTKLWYVDGKGYSELNGPNNVIIEALFLDDNVDVGETWFHLYTQEVGGFEFNYTYNYYYEELLSSYVVNDITYTNVKHVVSELLYEDGINQPLLLTVSDYYWDEEIGLLESKIVENGQVLQTTSLISYSFN